MIMVPLGVPKSVLTQKCGDAINTQQARRSKRNKIGDMLGFNTGPVDSKNPTAWQSIWHAIDKERKSYQWFKAEHVGIALDSSKYAAKQPIR